MRLYPKTDEISGYNPKACVSHAKGSFVWMENDPQPYLDFIMAYSSANFGHANPKIVEIVKDAAARIDNVSSFNYGPRDQLSRRLIDSLPFTAKQYQVYYPVGGAKGVDSALKIAALASKRLGVITFAQNFHGLASSIVGVSDTGFFSDQHTIFRRPHVTTALFPTTDKEAAESIRHLKSLLSRDSTIGTILFETVQGGAGFRIAPAHFYTELQKIVDSTGVLLIVDDIQMGVGRVGGLYSFEKLGLRPDIVLLGKSLAGGYYPLTAIIARKELFDAIDTPGPGLDSTFSNNGFGIYIANEVQKMVADDCIMQKVAAISVHFKALLESLFAKHERLIVSKNVIGLACGIEFKSYDIAKQVQAAAMRNHLIIQTAGVNGNYIKITPSLLSTPQELSAGIDILDKAFAEASAKEFLYA